MWTIFGAILLPIAVFRTTDLRPIVYAVLSLTAIRMILVALALKGARLRRDTVLLMGWFGPRGLASVVFTLLALLNFEEAQRSSDSPVIVATWTILLSVLAHGLSAGPLSTWYARRQPGMARWKNCRKRARHGRGDDNRPRSRRKQENKKTAIEILSGRRRPAGFLFGT